MEGYLSINHSAWTWVELRRMELRARPKSAPVDSPKYEGALSENFDFSLALSRIKAVTREEAKERDAPSFLLRTSKGVVRCETPSGDCEAWLACITPPVTATPSTLPPATVSAITAALIELGQREPTDGIFRLIPDRLESYHLSQQLLLRGTQAEGLHGVTGDSLAASVRRGLARSPESLLMNRLFHLWLTCVNDPRGGDAQAISPECSVQRIRALLRKLPAGNLTVLVRLLHVCRLIDQCKRAKMPARNLAIILGTTLLPSADIDALKQVKYTVAPLFIFLINHLHELVDYTADTFAEREGFSINVRGSLEDDPPVWADRPGVDGCAYPICAIL